MPGDRPWINHVLHSYTLTHADDENEISKKEKTNIFALSLLKSIETEREREYESDVFFFMLCIIYLACSKY